MSFRWSPTQHPHTSFTVLDTHTMLSCFNTCRNHAGSSFQNAGRFCPSSLALGPPKQAPSVARLLAPRWLTALVFGQPAGTDPRSPAQHKTVAKLSPKLAVWAGHRFSLPAHVRKAVIQAHQVLATVSCGAMDRYLDTFLSREAAARVDRHEGTMYLFVVPTRLTHWSVESYIMQNNVSE